MSLTMKVFSAVLFVALMLAVDAYDPEDKEIETIIPEPGKFEAFYPRETNGNLNSVARASHNHGSFFQNRNPGLSLRNFIKNKFDKFSLNILALIDVKNSAAYGFRFDGKRRFNFD